MATTTSFCHTNPLSTHNVIHISTEGSSLRYLVSIWVSSWRIYSCNAFHTWPFTFWRGWVLLMTHYSIKEGLCPTTTYYMHILMRQLSIHEAKTLRSLKIWLKLCWFSLIVDSYTTRLISLCSWMQMVFSWVKKSI